MDSPWIKRETFLSYISFLVSYTFLLMVSKHIKFQVQIDFIAGGLEQFSSKVSNGKPRTNLEVVLNATEEWKEQKLSF